MRSGSGRIGEAKLRKTLKTRKASGGRHRIDGRAKGLQAADKAPGVMNSGGLRMPDSVAPINRQSMAMNSPPRSRDISAAMQALATAKTSEVEMKFSSPREMASIMF